MSLPFSGDPASAAFPRVRPAKPVPLFQCDECQAVSRPPTNELIHKPDCSFTDQSTPMPPFHLVADPLAEIKARHQPRQRGWYDYDIRDIDWLVAEITRLRGRLGELEWASGIGDIAGGGRCPVCHEWHPHGHAEGCWMPKELRR